MPKGMSQLQGSICSCGDEGELIVGLKKFLQVARCFYNKVGQFSVALLDPQLDNNVLGILNSLPARKLISYNVYLQRLA